MPLVVVKVPVVTVPFQVPVALQSAAAFGAQVKVPEVLTVNAFEPIFGVISVILPEPASIFVPLATERIDPLVTDELPDQTMTSPPLVVMLPLKSIALLLAADEPADPPSPTVKPFQTNEPFVVELPPIHTMPPLVVIFPVPLLPP